MQGIIERNHKDLDRIANQFASDPIEAGDILGTMYEYIMKYGKSNDSKSRVLTLARFAAKNFRKHETIYSNYVASESEITICPEDDDEAPDTFEYFNVGELSLEDMTIASERTADLMNAIQQLSPNQQKIVSLLGDGFKPAEIARKLDVSRAAISLTLNKVQASLAAYA